MKSKVIESLEVTMNKLYTDILGQRDYEEQC